MAKTYLLVLVMGVVALIAPSLAHFHKPSHHNHISPAFSPNLAPDHNPHFHKPGYDHEQEHPKEEHKPLTPAEPPKSGFFPPTHKPVPHHGHFPAHPPVKSGEGPHMPPYWRKPPTAHHMAPPPIHAY